MLGILDLHVRGELIGEAADFASAHSVRLPRHGKRTAAGLADAARRQMAVDDGVDLVGARARLIDALRIDGDGLLGTREEIE